MRKYRKWVVTLGLVAAAPNVGLAGPFDFLRNEPEAKAEGVTNQQVAESVAKQLKTADVKGSEIEIEFQNGTLTFKGQAPDAGTKALISRLGSGVTGVDKVDNHMTIAGSGKTATPQASAPMGVESAEYEAPSNETTWVRQASESTPAMADGRSPRQPVTPVTYMQDEAAPVPAPGPAATVGPPMGPPAGYPGPAGAMPPGAMPPPGAMHPGAMPPGAVPPAPPAWAQGGAAATGAVYDQPALPQHAWPSYAAYPNYAALTYPRQHSASAWPYIGPYYPYPQVPLGWRDVNLQWDDGHWYLDFNDRTDKWWWFMNPKKW